MKNGLDMILLRIIISVALMVGYAIGSIKIFYMAGAFTTRKVTKNKNNVRFYVARNKSSNILWLYLGKPIRGNYREYWTGNGPCKGICMEYNFSDVGLDKNDYKDLKWEDEPVEVFLNLE